LVASGAATFILLIAFSRLYLGAHWLSDVLGGLAFGSTWLALLGLSYLRQQAEHIRPVKLLAVVCATLALAGGFHVYRSHATDSERYAIQHSTPVMVAADWWASDWQQLPARRIDLAGEMEEPLTFQWAGGLQYLQDVLQRNGWRASRPLTPLGALTWLTASADPPVIPLFASGRLPSLTFVRPSGDAAAADSRLVLRLWVVDLELTNGDKSPLWIGSVVEERLYRPFSLFTLTSTQSDANGPRQVLAAALGKGRLVSRTDGSTGPDWDNQVFLSTH
jgi:hypothetical protein